jgi:phosphopentomutase
VLDALSEHGVVVKSVGKTADLFANKGIGESHPTESNAEGMRKIESVWAETEDGLVFANLVDFDTVYGHRRDPAGYGRALEDFDSWLSGFLRACGPEDLLVITADHGNDPTYRGTDHTREEVPLLVRYGGRTQNLGVRETFADVAATLAGFFGLEPGWPVGRSFLTAARRARRSSRRRVAR